MTREEEIKQGSIDCIGHVNECNPLPWISFREGAKWADSHPRKGLVDIDKAIRWLKDRADSFAYISAHSGEAKVSNKIVEEFEKAMME